MDVSKDGVQWRAKELGGGYGTTRDMVQRGHTETQEAMRWRRVGVVEVVERGWRDPLTPTLHDISNDGIAEGQVLPFVVSFYRD